MKVLPSPIPEVLVLEPQVFGDARGFFFESFNERAFRDATGLDTHFVQDNHSRSAKGVLRGLHYQLQQPQGKLVRVVRGAVFDVAVDIRVGSPTFGHWDAVRLDEESRRTIYLSEGLAHGFLALEDDSTVMYLCSAPYSPTREHTILATDPALAIEWPAGFTPSLSDRDLHAPTLAEVAESGTLPTWEDTRSFVEGLRTRLG